MISVAKPGIDRRQASVAAVQEEETMVVEARQTPQHRTPPQPGPQKQKKKKPSKIAMVRMGYEQLVCTVVRPPRVSYGVEDLGMPCKRVNGAFVERVDFEVANDRGETLRCSRWAPNPATRRHILYLHSNSSCRLAVVRSPLLATAASLGATLVAFDFAGCGISDGDVVTLGIHERADVAKLIATIKARDPAAQIVLWGRSMGAASALLYCEAYDDPAVSALVLDSPFLSLKTLADDVVKRVAPKAPRCGVACLLCCLKRSVKSRTGGVDVMKVSCEPAARKATRPLFVSGVRDVLAPPKTHGEPLERAYAAPSKLLTFDGERPPRPWI
ncbi:palmitoyl-(protein) hydrolase [Aureococcus anophagefferens]|nr:palmitoyl-(protein) hydrolase [Aureococcus anophagefferens]